MSDFHLFLNTEDMTTKLRNHFMTKYHMTIPQFTIL